MALLRRPQSAAHRIEEFWAWWGRSGSRECGAALAAGDPGAVADEMTRRVHAVEPGLAWEFGPGAVSAHVLVVTAEGDGDLRPLARQWLVAAPPADGTWSYSDLRAPAPDPTQLVLSSNGPGSDIAFVDVLVGARRRGTRLDVVVHHPAFGDLPGPARLQIAFLALDAALGEAGVELWIGEIETSSVAPLDGFGLPALAAVVRDLSHEYVDQDGRSGWQILQGETAAGPVLASTVVPLHPLLAPHLTVHLAVAAQYADRTETGLPGPTALDRLRALEDDLVRALGRDGMVVAHESSGGVRVLHAYASPEWPATRRGLADELTWPEGRLDVRLGEDPGWQRVRHLRA